jgi:hypothetical protein
VQKHRGTSRGTDILVARAAQFKLSPAHIAAMANEEVKQENKHLTLMVENQAHEQVQFKVIIWQGATYFNSSRWDGARLGQLTYKKLHESVAYQRSL